MSLRTFDLNIEEVLENWEVEHAIREIIANALDEQVLTHTQEIRISKDHRGDWHIRDFGRGLRIDHFTLNENQEKLNAENGIIGKFGVGMKDALATFHRRGIGVLIGSAFGTYRLKQEHKHGFNEILTLHVEFDDSPRKLSGTEFALRGVSDAIMAKAKSFFMKFADEDLLETTAFGQILRRKENGGRVYIVGVLASEEQNFLFSYNVTKLTDSMRKKLNRERLNVGRTTYVDRIKSILKCAGSETVHSHLVDQIHERATGEQRDELSWIEISQLALNLMSKRQRVVYLTEEEVQIRPEILDNLKSDSIKVVIVTEQQKAKLQSQVESGGPNAPVLENYIEEYNASFQYSFVNIRNLTQLERRTFELTARIFDLVGLDSIRVPPVLISESLGLTRDDTQGVWDPNLQAIVIRRTMLRSPIEYAATLLHEVAHAISGAHDTTREFERVLTDFLGKIAVVALRL